MVTDKRMTSILDLLIEGVYIVSPDWRLLYVNNTMASYMKCSKEQVLGRTILEVYPGFEETEVYAAYKRSMDQGVVTQKEIEFEFPDSSKGCFEIKIQPVEEGILVLAVDVTERNKAKQKIAYSERLLSDSQKIAHIGSWEWDIMADKITWSDEMYRMFGFQPGEFEATFEALLKCTHPDDAPSLNELVQQSFHNHKDFEQYYRIIRPDGTIRIVHGKGYVVVENGVPIKMRGVSQDVTERRIAEENITKNEQRLAESQTVAHIGSWEWDIGADKISWSDELYRIFGLEPEEFEATYENFLKYAHPDDRQLVNDSVQQAFNDYNDFEHYYRVVRPNGTERIVHGKGSVVVENGVVVKMRGVAQDVTERKLAEEEVAKQKRFTEAVLNDIPGDVAVLDTNHNYVFINRRAISNSELRQWLIGKNDFDYCRHKGIDDTLAHKRKKFFDDAVQSKSDVEWIDEQQNSQGQTVYTLRRFHPVFEAEQLAYVIGYGINITDLKTAEIKLAEAVQLAQSAFKEMEQFAYMVSHDLQEPLRMVSSFLSLLKQRTANQLDDTAKEYIYYAVDGADRMKIMIEDLLQFSRINTGAQNLKAVEVNKVLQYVIHVQHMEIKKHNVQVTVHQLPVITANYTLITELFMNLVGNAIKYNNKPNPQVEVGSTEDATKWTFYIKDNGIGIAQESLEKVFVIFKRLHPKQEYSGTGIGLALCKKIVEKHGGRIWVESSPGEGSTFYFTISKNIDR